MLESSSQALGEAAEFHPIRLTGGEFELDAGMDARIRAACNAPARDGDVAHPIFAFVCGIGGLAVPVASAIALAGCSIDAGPLLASCEIDIHRVLQVGLTYQVAASISEKLRKGSRRFGATDHLLFHIEISHEAVRFADLHLRMIVPVVAA